jgi:hypothetical protein
VIAVNAVCRANLSDCDNVSLVNACFAPSIASPQYWSSLTFSFDSKLRAYSSRKPPR